MIQDTRHYFRIPFEITTEPKFKEMSNSAQVLYMVLCRLANNYADKKTNWFYRSLKFISQDSGLNPKTVIRAKKELLSNNFIDVERSYWDKKQGRATDSYKINGFQFRMSEK